MVSPRINKKQAIIVLVALALVPVIITAYEVIFAENNSIIFLGSYPPKVAILVVVYYFILLCLGIFWFVKQIIFISKLKNEKAKAELMLLQSQVSPHFFFNMLNNIYGLVAKDTQKAQALILKLSDLMRYSIYEGGKETVSLQEEIDFLKNYIELNKMRYHKNIRVDFNCDADGQQRVVPLMFIILLENAFKHGVENLRENAYIKINLATSGKDIHFTVENNFDKNESKSGIGLKNLKRRLELIYPDQHDLSFFVKQNIYKAQLILK